MSPSESSFWGASKRQTMVRNCAPGNLEVPGSMLRIAPERRRYLFLRQKADHRLGEGVRLLHVGYVRSIEDGHAGAGDSAAHEFGICDRGRHVVAAGDHQRWARNLWQQF